MRTRRLGTMVLVAGLSLWMAAPAQAAAGDLDPTFSGDGIALASWGDSAAGYDVATGPNGTIYVVVHSWAVDPYRMTCGVIRYRADGAVDPSFGVNGRAAAYTGEVSCNDIVVQPDGKIVVIGGMYFVDCDDTKWAVARLLSDGMLDPTFGAGDGLVTSRFATCGEQGFNSDPYGVALQPDGRIVVVGESRPGMSVARYLPDGALDPTFSGDGKAVLGTSSTTRAYGRDVVIKPTGAIIIAGNGQRFDDYTGEIEARYVLVARLRPGGSLDPAFGTGGITRIPVEPTATQKIALRSDGKLVLAGNVAASGRVFVARLLSTGALDPTFGTGGIVKPTGWYFALGDLALQADAKMVLVGGTPFTVARLRASGVADTSFSGDGLARLRSYAGANGVVLQGNGSIVAAGRTVVPGPTPSKVVVARFLAA